jgi:hypothetical protein
MGIEGRAADICPLDQVVNGERLEAALEDQLDQRADQRLPRPLRPAIGLGCDGCLPA